MAVCSRFDQDICKMKWLNPGSAYTQAIEFTDTGNKCEVLFCKQVLRLNSI